MRYLSLIAVLAALFVSAGGGTIVWGDFASPDTVVWGN